MTVGAEVFRTAVRRFKTHPLQTWLTLTGLIVGTAAIIVIVALGLTGRAFVMAQIEAVGSHVIWANYQGNITSGVFHAVDDRINEADTKAIAARTDLFTGVTPLVELKGNVTVESRAADVAILGTTPNYPKIRKNVAIMHGRFLDDDDLDQRSKVCVVSRSLYEKLFTDDRPGKTVHTLGMTFLVIGEFTNPVDTMGQGEMASSDLIFIPITVAWFFTGAHRVDTLFADVRDFDMIPTATQTIVQTLRDRHHAGAVFTADSMTTVVKVARTISTGLIIVFILAASVSVIVGGVGIMNILLASVEHRTREIGIRRSLGARKKDILAQFLVEALILGSTGSAVGVLFGLAIPVISRTFVHQVAIHVSPLSAVLAFAFSAAVTLVFGVIPAHRAANLEPTEALRHE